MSYRNIKRIRECSYLAIIFVNIGDRQDDREKGGNVFISKIDSKIITKKILTALKFKNKLKKSKIYGNGNSSEKIVSILKKIKLDINKKFIILNK